MSNKDIETETVSSKDPKGSTHRLSLNIWVPGLSTSTISEDIFSANFFVAATSDDVSDKPDFKKTTSFKIIGKIDRSQ